MSDAGGYFAALRAAHALAAERIGGAREIALTVAGGAVRLKFAGERLWRALSPSFAHLAAHAGDADLTVLLCDSAETGVDMPELPPEARVVFRRGDIAGIDGGRVLAAYNAGMDVVVTFDPRAGVAAYWATDATRLPQYEVCAPLRPAFNWWLRGRGLLLHAAVVGVGGQGVMLVGEGGSGKSTTALACLQAGFDYLGDDYVAVTFDGPVPTAHSAYCRAKVTDASAALLPELVARAGVERGGPGEKTMLNLWPAYAPQLAAGLPIHAIALPRVAGAPATRSWRASGAESLRHVAISTLRQLAGDGPAEFAWAAQLVRSAPNFALDLGRDIDQVPARVAELVSHV